MNLMFIAATGSLWLLAGCDSPAMREARHNREQYLTRSLAIVGSLDEHRSENLARTGRIITEKYQEDVRNTRRNKEAIDRLIREEFETWAEREPSYRRAIAREFQGDPANIERTVPHFIY
jgi:hypothetical protein